MIVAVVAAAGLAVVASRLHAGEHLGAGPVDDLSEVQCRKALGIMFSGLPADAAAFIDSLESTCGQGPLYRLTRARVYREVLPVDDENKDVLAGMAEPIYADLDMAIDYCTRQLESDKEEASTEDGRLLLYRGWAWMFKSHIRTFERSFWSAGRDAKKGRGDLREYLELHPDDPIANGIMGTFLYFADTLPAAFKFISKLLFMPTGDREEGLRRMVTSCEHHSLIEVDNKTLLFSVYIAFEGRYEDGLDGFLRLHRRYPDYPSFVRPFALTLPFTPRDRDEVMAMLEPMLDRDRNRTRFRQDPGPYAMLQFTRAYADRFYDPRRARRDFEAIIADDPAHPDWVPSYSAFALARQLAAAGDYDGARKRLRAVLDDRSGAYLHGEARSLLDALDDAGEPHRTDVGEIDVAAIYSGERQAIERVAEQLRGAEMTATNPGVQTGFYLAEALFMLGDEDGALDMFRSVLERDAPLWDESFQLIACSRLAEIHGSRLQYEQAARYLDRAPDYYHKEFLYDWLFEGRKRFYERIAGGEFNATPTLFSNVP